MGEPNARDMGRMTSQPKAKGEMYILNDGMNMKAEIAAMERRLEELEMKHMQPVQAISQTPLQAMPCAICLSYEHLVDECPTIPAEREMLGDCNTYNFNWRDHPNFSWKPQPPQYQQPAQAPQQASNLEQTMVNLCKKLDILQDSISRLANLNTVQEKENSPSQPSQNSMSIHEMEAKEGKPSQKKEVKEVITLRSGKEVDLPTCKLEHKVESETEKEKREEIKGKKKGKSFWMIKIKRNCKEIEEKKSEQNRSQTERKQGKNRGLRDFAASAKSAFCCQTIRNTIEVSAKIFAAAKPFWHTSATSQHRSICFAAAKRIAK
ncbi:hypothetical protein CK203_036487 [Vitis vinifera]|uniref:Retrotransposon gag protein n=1 Tax=Vitis vinifera TaxID=29760 RepID=A0A438HZP8_VITVI|nr:hypothetical protein CK203_036487 [Vitis vinifera]